MTVGPQINPDKAAHTVYYACKETILAAVEGASPSARPPVGSYKAPGGEVMSDQECNPGEAHQPVQRHRRGEFVSYFEKLYRNYELPPGRSSSTFTYMTAVMCWTNPGPA